MLMWVDVVGRVVVLDLAEVKPGFARIWTG